MKGLMVEISKMIKEFGSAPTFEDMPRKTLVDKCIAGPTTAHTIEEVHTPLNLAYITFTTGSSAFQNIVGVTFTELPRRIEVSFKIFERSGLKRGDRVLVTYPPLVNVFSGEAFKSYGLEWSFLIRSSRDAFLAALYEFRPKAVFGESSFIRASLEDALNMGVSDELPKNIKLLTAGTPLDLELLPIAKTVLNAQVHDLYGCQEFGWLCMDGVPLRDDIEMVKVQSNKKQDMFELVVGGLPTGDSFPLSDIGHICNCEGKIITYRRERSYPEYEVIVRKTTLKSIVTLDRVARSILRIKGRIIKKSPYIVTESPNTVLELRPDYINAGVQEGIIIKGPQKTIFFDDMVKAQIDYQRKAKADPTWTKKS